MTTRRIIFHVYPTRAEAQHAIGFWIGSRWVQYPASRWYLSTGTTFDAAYPTAITFLHTQPQSPDLCELRTFNADEYCDDRGVPLAPDDTRAFTRYMRVNCFDGLECFGFDERQARFPSDSVVQPIAVGDALSGYDDLIAADGGLDFAVIGIGPGQDGDDESAHFAFVEPSDDANWLDKGTTRFTLNAETRRANATNAGCNGDPDRVPPSAYTIGAKSLIVGAPREVCFAGLGSAKSGPMHGALFGPVGPRCPASLIQVLAQNGSVVHAFFDTESFARVRERFCV
ncbi:MAG: hypothetical protein KDD44_14095 [Bdellovibrionales bacterium]|nr:hypothetical protein [Bdellovibrionales bacterium]